MIKNNECSIKFSYCTSHKLTVSFGCGIKRFMIIRKYYIVTMLFIAIVNDNIITGSKEYSYRSTRNKNGSFITGLILSLRLSLYNAFSHYFCYLTDRGRTYNIIITCHFAYTMYIEGKAIIVYMRLCSYYQCLTSKIHR